MGQDLHDAISEYAPTRLAIAEIYFVSSVYVHLSSNKILNIWRAGHGVHEQRRGLGIIMERGNSELRDRGRDLDWEGEIEA